MNAESGPIRPLLSVVVPVFNEMLTVNNALRRIINVAVEKQVIVVDDGSTDDTPKLLLEWKNTSQIEVLRHDVNRGKGAAIRTALSRAYGAYTIIQDADLEYDPCDYVALIAPLLRGEADVVYGSRYALPGKSIGAVSRTSRWGVSLLNWIVWILYGRHLSDEATCYKVFPTEILKGLELKCDGFDFCPEVTAKILRIGLILREVPISYTPRTVRDGKKVGLRDGIIALQRLWEFRNWVPPAALKVLCESQREPFAVEQVCDAGENASVTSLRRGSYLRPST